MAKAKNKILMISKDKVTEKKGMEVLMLVHKRMYETENEAQIFIIHIVSFYTQSSCNA